MVGIEIISAPNNKMSVASLDDYVVSSQLKPVFESVGGGTVSVVSRATNGAIPFVPDQQYSMYVDDSANLVFAGQSAAPSPATQPITVAPDGTVTIPKLVGGGGGGGGGVTSLSDGTTTATGGIVVAGSQGVTAALSGQTLTLSGPPSLVSSVAAGGSTVSGAVSIQGAGGITAAFSGQILTLTGTQAGGGSSSRIAGLQGVTLSKQAGVLVQDMFTFTSAQAPGVYQFRLDSSFAATGTSLAALQPSIPVYWDGAQVRSIYAGTQAMTGTNDNLVRQYSDDNVTAFSVCVKSLPSPNTNTNSATIQVWAASSLFPITLSAWVYPLVTFDN